MRSATFSSLTVCALALLASLATPASAQTVITQGEALRLAFPTATSIERRTAYLSDAQRARAQDAAGVEIEAGIVTYYVATKGAQPLGVAYFDAHRVRTLPEVAMIVVSPAGRIERIEILKFSEPPQYRAPDGWLRQFDGKALDPSLSLKGDIVNITGATLTANAITRAGRKILALHRTIDPFGRPSR